MNIGFDLDKVLIDYPPFIPDRIIDRFYKKKTNGILQYRIPAKPEQFFRKLLHLSILRPPIEENLEFLKKFPKKGNKVYLISSRFSFLNNITNALIKRNRLDEIFDGLYFNFRDEQPHMFKEVMVKKLKLKYYVDDDLPLLQYLTKRNKNTRFYWLTKPNKVKAISESNILAISNLSAIFSK